MEEPDLHKVVSDLEHKKEMMLNRFISPPSGSGPPAQQQPGLSSSGSTLNSRQHPPQPPRHVPVKSHDYRKPNNTLHRRYQKSSEGSDLLFAPRHPPRTIQSQFSSRSGRSPTSKQIYREMKPQCVDKPPRSTSRRTKTAFQSRTVSPFTRVSPSRGTAGPYPRLPPPQRAPLRGGAEGGY